MTMKRYVARDMRTALRQVRDEQGPDAVILSTQSVPGGVEVCAAADGDIQLLQQSLNSTSSALAASPVSSAEFETERAAMSGELRSLRRLLEQQVSALAWNDYTRREPQRAQLLGALQGIGIQRELASKLVQQLPAEVLADPAICSPGQLLAAALTLKELPTATGGVVAVVGPPGSGKSTTLAKLAVRAVLEHGSGSLTLITTDTARLGAAEQTRSLGRLLKVPVHVLVDAEELTMVLSSLQHQRLVLIDTAGVSLHHDEGMQELRSLLTAGEGLQSLLMLPGSAQAEVQLEIARQFAAPYLHSVVLTRADEACSLGGAIGALIATRLPVSAVCDGARIPEDLSVARAAELVTRAVRLTDRNTEFEGVLNVA
jgi:flagellar biosynthesis protein FlhF